MAAQNLTTRLEFLLLADRCFNSIPTRHCRGALRIRVFACQHLDAVCLYTEPRQMEQLLHCILILVRNLLIILLHPWHFENCHGTFLCTYQRLSKAEVSFVPGLHTRWVFHGSSAVATFLQLELAEADPSSSQ